MVNPTTLAEYHTSQYKKGTTDTSGQADIKSSDITTGKQVEIEEQCQKHYLNQNKQNKKSSKYVLIHSNKKHY